ncbi:hypothetical protein [Spiroplasma poulsonii]|nr:hypothetical protein [Spiroplasma poulsonii]
MCDGNWKEIKKIPNIEFQIGVVTRNVKITYDETLVSKEAIFQQI